MAPKSMPLVMVPEYLLDEVGDVFREHGLRMSLTASGDGGPVTVEVHSAFPDPPIMDRRIRFTLRLCFVWLGAAALWVGMYFFLSWRFGDWEAWTGTLFGGVYAVIQAAPHYGRWRLLRMRRRIAVELEHEYFSDKNLPTR